MILVEDLTCGDVFLFRRSKYLCLSAFTEVSREQSLITAVRYDFRNGPNFETVVPFNLLRRFKVKVVGKYHIHLADAKENTEEEMEEA